MRKLSQSWKIIINLVKSSLQGIFIPPFSDLTQHHAMFWLVLFCRMFPFTDFWCFFAWQQETLDGMQSFEGIPHWKWRIDLEIEAMLMIMWWPNQTLRSSLSLVHFTPLSQYGVKKSIELLITSIEQSLNHVKIYKNG